MIYVVLLVMWMTTQTSEMPYGPPPVAAGNSSCVWWPGRMRPIC